MVSVQYEIAKILTNASPGNKQPVRKGLSNPVYLGFYYLRQVPLHLIWRRCEIRPIYGNPSPSTELSTKWAELHIRLSLCRCRKSVNAQIAIKPSPSIGDIGF